MTRHVTSSVHAEHPLINLVVCTRLAVYITLSKKTVIYKNVLHKLNFISRVEQLKIASKGYKQQFWE